MYIDNIYLHQEQTQCIVFAMHFDGASLDSKAQSRTNAPQINWNFTIFVNTLESHGLLFSDFISLVHRRPLCRPGHEGSRWRSFGSQMILMKLIAGCKETKTCCKDFGNLSTFLHLFSTSSLVP